MTDYPTLTAQLQQEAELREDALPIRNAACRSRFWLHPQPRQRVCLLFHGFTAGSYQSGRWVKHYLSQDIMCWLRDYLVMEERGIGIA